ncbi:MAG: AMP-binding protein [Deferribacteraceae bacterium]|nr:AMP-binding protein [Deferribacteraceae bacterium]
MEKYEFANVRELFIKIAKRFSKKTYIFFYDKKISYQKTYEESVRVANALAANGVKQGDRVAILISNSPEFLYAYFGAVMLGTVTVPVNTFLSGREAAVNLNDCGAKYLISSVEFEKVVSVVKEDVKSLDKVFSFGETAFNSVDLLKYSIVKDFQDVEITSEDLATLLYTSGTTGVPKGVMLTHNNLMANIYGFKVKLSSRSKDRFVALLPLFHAYAFTTCILGPLEAGCSIILLASVKDMAKKQFKKQLVLLRPTVLIGIPQLYTALTKLEPNWITRLLFPFYLCVSGGAPLAMEILNKFYQSYGKAVVEGYGLSEASPIVSFNPRTRPKAGTIGTQLYNLEVKVVDQDGNTLPINTNGELCVRGASIMKGYWNKPEETAQALKDGWLHTGDIAYIDEEGYIVIVDRIKDLIISKGLNVYPREIEELLYKYPGIQLAAVIGVKVKNDEVVAAYISVDENYDEKNLRDYLKENLAAYKHPKNIIVSDKIPITSSGKIAKQTLKEMVYKGEI